MGTTVYYAKGKGPFGNGEGRATRYAKLQQKVLEMYNDPNNPAAKRELAQLSGTMVDLIQRHATAAQIERLAAGFQKRDVGPTDAQGVPILGNLSVAYSSGEMIGMELLPVAPVDQISGEYVQYPRRDRMQVVRGEGRGRRGSANEIPLNETTVPYLTKAHQHKGVQGLDGIIAGRIAQKRAPVDRLARMVDSVGFHHQLEHEAKCIETLTDTGNYNSAHKLALTAGLHWDQQDAEIGANILSAKDKLWSGQGNSEVIGFTSAPVWSVMRRNTALVGTLAASDRGFLTEAQFCEIFGLDGLMVSDLKLDTANIGATEVDEFSWGNNFGIIRVSRTPQQLNAAWGYTMRWNAYDVPMAGLMNGNEGIFTRLWFDPDEGPFGSFVYKQADYWGLQVVAADTGFLFSDCLATFPSA